MPTKAKKEATRVEKAQESAKKVFLANLGAYSRTYEEVKKRVEKLNNDSQKLFDNLAKDGEGVQSKVEGQYKTRTEKVEAQITKLKAKVPYLGLESKLDDVSSKLDKLAKA